VKAAHLAKAATNPSLVKAGNNPTATVANRAVIAAASVEAAAATMGHAETAVAVAGAAAAGAGGDNPSEYQFKGEPATARLFLLAGILRLCLRHRICSTSASLSGIGALQGG
jgi:hypothetical protein